MLKVQGEMNLNCRSLPFLVHLLIMILKKWRGGVYTTHDTIEQHKKNT